MSTVGPRPALPAEVATYDTYQRQRLLVKPGLTCYWQTRRNRDSITFDEWVDLDLWEGEHRLVREDEARDASVGGVESLPAEYHLHERPFSVLIRLLASSTACRMGCPCWIPCCA